jgi:glycosyltransferase involved in cell wall biosynthesis
MATKKKKILFMCQLPPPVHGAALRNLSLLESKLLNEEFIFVPLPLQFASSVKDIGRFSIKKLFIAFSYCAKLFWILSTQRIHLAYFTMSPFGFAFYRDVMIVSLLKLFRVKRLYHFRVKGIKKTASSSLGKRLVKYSFRNSDIICLSKHHLLDLDNLNFREPFLVPNGIRIEESYREQPFVDKQPLEIIFISNLARTKGVYDLLEALKQLHRSGTRFIARYIGAEHDISFAELERDIKAAGLEGKVIVAGPKYDREKFELLNQSDIFVFPTYFELFPGVVLEAMQFKKAIVASTEGSIPEMIDDGKNGLLVPVQDPAALAIAIQRLCDEKTLRAELAKNAREKFLAEFTMDKFETNMQQVFERVLHHK